MSKISPVIIEEAFRLKDNEILRLRAENEKLQKDYAELNETNAKLLVLERKRAEKLRTALKPFADRSEKLHSGYDDGIAARDYPMVFVMVQDLRAAAAALKETGDE